MLQLTLFLILFTATSLFYLSNRHQRLLSKPINKSWRKLAFILFVIAIPLALYAFSNAAAVFFIILMIMLALIIIPLVSLIKRKEVK